MWPMRSEMTRDECRKCLRCLELDAYGSMVSVLRAQGPFTNEKQKLLQELAKVLHISNERHRAEIRRAVNDEKLATIAEQLNGPNTGIDWTLEGRRSIPLLPRLKARSAFTTLANSLSLTTAIANNKKPDRCNIVRQSENSTAAETESHPRIEMEESLSVDSKLNNLEDDLDNSKTSQENSNLIENETIDNKDVFDKVTEKSKESSRKRKSPSPLPTAPPNKVLVISEPSNHILRISENKQSQVLQVTKHQNFALIKVNETSDSVESTTVSEHPSECTTVSLNKHVVVTTTSVCTNHASNPKMAVSTDQNKINTKVVPAISSCILSINKVHSSKDTQPQDSTNGTQKTQPDNINSILSDNISSNSSTTKSSMTLCDPIIQNYTRMTSARLTQSMPVYPGTTVSSGPGPPQVKQVPITLMCTKLPSEQIVTFDQSTAKTGIFPKKVINMPHYNTKLNKANVIVIQKANSVTLSHAGKEVLGKVIMEGKNLCVTSQHNANSINVQPHHISLNNGDQTKTMLPTVNSPQNAESVKTNIKSGKTVVSVTRFRHDVQENKVLSQLFDSPAICNVEAKTLIQDINACLPKEECNNDKNTIDRESSLKTDSMITSISEETQHRSVQSNSNNIEYRKNNDVKVNINSQDTNLLESSKSLRSKEIVVRPKEVHDDVEDDVRIEKSGENVDTFNATLESTNKNLQSFQYLVDNDENSDLEKSSRSMVTVNQMDEHDDS
ncbi:PREDICTED: BRCA2-interacting transcriptional repressor EMSY isoform X3 [Trachymyrmex cornetzi]|nr:PREDICTED: BRCA2-interacting transcriptional repressor EMSY isoform X3 [Trachymyrmex cornetzi]